MGYHTGYNPLQASINLDKTVKTKALCARVKCDDCCTKSIQLPIPAVYLIGDEVEVSEPSLIQVGILQTTHKTYQPESDVSRVAFIF